jgi:hypothetical protein
VEALGTLQGSLPQQNRSKDFRRDGLRIGKRVHAEDPSLRLTLMISIGGDFWGNMLHYEDYISTTVEEVTI